jgi:hypothetical protein
MDKDAFVSHVESKVIALQKCGLWEREPKLRPTAWINNFPTEERYYAAHMLDRFLYMSDDVTNLLLRRSFRHFVNHHLNNCLTNAQAKQSYEALRQSICFTGVEGENPNQSDSGLTFCRKARQELRVPERLIVSPQEALLNASRGYTIVFLDDFSGSGEQIVKMLKRKYSDTHPYTFLDAQSSARCALHYLLPITTSNALVRLRREDLPLKMHAAHILTERYTIHSIADVEVKTGIYHLLRQHSQALIVPEFMGDTDSRMFGFHQLGLTVAFSHSVPDSSLPILWAAGGRDWTPLAERR